MLCNGVGCGVIEAGRAMYGMGTYICMMPVFAQRREPRVMIERGLNTDHHAAPGRYVSFIYNHGGSMVKWFRDTFAQAERIQAKASGQDVYPQLTSEMPDRPSSILALPHWGPTGPPEFIADSSRVQLGLKLDTTRGDILKGLIEATTFYLRECLEALPAAGITIKDFRVGVAARAVLGGTHAAILPEIAAAAFAGRRVRALALPFEAQPARTILLAAHPRVDETLFESVARALGAGTVLTLDASILAATTESPVHAAARRVSRDIGRE